MTKHLSKYICAFGLMVIISGCQCSKKTARYANFIDRVSDKKIESDRFYYPGLDVSRAGMPDWRQFAWNHKFCLCDCNCCRMCCQPADYPACATMKFYAQEAESLENTDGLTPAPSEIDYYEQPTVRLPKPEAQPEM